MEQGWEKNYLDFQIFSISVQPHKLETFLLDSGADTGEA